MNVLNGAVPTSGGDRDGDQAVAAGTWGTDGAMLGAGVRLRAREDERGRPVYPQDELPHVESHPSSPQPPLHQSSAPQEVCQPPVTGVLALGCADTGGDLGAFTRVSR